MDGTYKDFTFETTRMASAFLLASACVLGPSCGTGGYHMVFLEGLFGPGPPRDSSDPCLGWDFATPVPCEAFEDAGEVTARTSLNAAQAVLAEYSDELVAPAPMVVFMGATDENSNTLTELMDSASREALDDQYGTGIVLQHSSVEGTSATWQTRVFRWCSEDGAPETKTLELEFYDLQMTDDAPYATAQIDLADLDGSGRFYLGDQTASSVLFLTTGCFDQGGY